MFIGETTQRSTAQKPAVLGKDCLPHMQEPTGITLSSEAAGHVTSGFGVKEFFKKDEWGGGKRECGTVTTLPLNKTFREAQETQPQTSVLRCIPLCLCRGPAAPFYHLSPPTPQYSQCRLGLGTPPMSEQNSAFTKESHALEHLLPTCSIILRLIIPSKGVS